MEKKQQYTRLEVILIIEDLLQHADVIMDSITSEDPQYDAEELLEIVEESNRNQYVAQIEISDAHQYNGNNAGELEAFVQNKPLSEARELTVNDPLMRMCMHIPDTSEIKGWKQLCWVPTEWGVRDVNGKYYSISNEEYKTKTSK